jgi:hypothetical protein
LDDRRSHARPNSRGRHPEKPNKFWNESKNKVAPSGKKIDSKIGFNDDSPRATNFPDLEVTTNFPDLQDFLGRAPDDTDPLTSSPSPLKISAGKSSSNPLGLSPLSETYNEDD